MNKSSKFHRLMQVLAMFLCVAMVAGTFGTANAAGGNNNDNSAKITISTPPKSIDFYNEHGESANWKPTFSLTAKIQNVAYQDGMKLILNWQEKHAGSDVFVDSPLIVDDNHPENTILSSQIKRDAVEYGYVKYVNVGTPRHQRYEYVWQDMNISLPITSADGKNVARNGAIFRCKIILVDKNNNEICSVMSNEVKVNYTVRVTLHDGVKTEDIKVPYNQAVTIPESYNQEGYVTEWQTKAAYTNKYEDFDITQKITAPVDLYVNRTKLVTVSFNMNGHGTQIPSQTFAAGQKAKEPAKPQATDGYDFVEWKDAEGNKYDFSKKVNESITLTAEWKASTIRVTLYYYGHGYTPWYDRNAPSYIDVPFQSKDGIPMNLECKNPNTTEDHKFIGWYLDKDFTDLFTMPEDGITGPITLHAKWGTYYTVEFKAGNGFTLKNAIDSKEVEKVGNSGKVSAPSQTPVATAEGYEFEGWYSDASCKDIYKVTFPKTISGNTTFYAKFVEKPTVTIILHSNGHGNDDSTDTIYKGNTYAVPEALTSDDTTHDTFLGWFIDAECTEAYEAKEINANLDLYAGWKTEYTVKFDANGKTFVGSYGNQKVVKGNSIILSANVTENSGKYDFTGWTLNGESVSGDYTVNGDVTFVANWTAKLETVQPVGTAQNEYYVGDSFNPTGLQIQYSYSDGTTKEYDVTLNNCRYDFSTAGAKTVTISFDGHTFEYGVTVKKYAGYVDVVTESISATYGDSPITILGEAASDTPVVKSGKQDVVKIENNEVVIVGVGTTEVTVTVGATDTHEGTTVIIPVTISPKTLTVGWDEETLILEYNGDEQAPKVVVEGILDGDICNVTVSGQKTNVGNDYVATVSVDNQNYVIAEADASTSFSIVPKTVEVIWTNTELDYNGTEQGPDAALADGSICENDVVTVTVNGKNTTVGDEYVAVASISNDNYVINENTKSTAYSIVAKTIEIEWSNTELIYNGSEQKPTATVKAGEICEGDTCVVTVTGAQTGAGTYTAYASLDNENYVISNDFAETEFVIAPKEVKELTVTIGTLVCGTEIEPLVAEGTLRAFPMGLRFKQNWNNVTVKFSDEDAKYSGMFIIAGNLSEETESELRLFTGTIEGGKNYMSGLQMQLDPNHVLASDAKVTVTYGNEALKQLDVSLFDSSEDMLKAFESNTVVVTEVEGVIIVAANLLAVHVPGEAVKDEESVVAATFEAEGSYDMIVKCTECGEVLSRESFPLGKLVPEIKEITFGGFDQAKKDYLIDEDLDVSGLSVEVKWTNGDVTKEDVKKEWVSGFNSKVENKALVLSVSYHGKAATYTVSVSEPAGEFIVEGDTKFNGKDNMKLHIIHTNAKRNALIFSQFGGIEMDGKVVGTVNYDATEGSIKLDIHADYLKTLTEGEHTLTVDIGEDKVDVKISVTQIKEEPTQPAQQAATSDNAPSTGDTGSLVLWYVIALIALLSAAALAVARQKSRREEF